MSEKQQFGVDPVDCLFMGGHAWENNPLGYCVRCGKPLDSSPADEPPVAHDNDQT